MHKTTKMVNLRNFCNQHGKGDNQGNVAKMACNVKIHKGLVNMRCEEGPLRMWKI